MTGWISDINDTLGSNFGQDGILGVLNANIVSTNAIFYMLSVTSTNPALTGHNGSALNTTEYWTLIYVV